MRTIVLTAAALALCPSAASAQTMNADIFYKRASALMKKGPMALFSRGEISALMTEGKAAGKRSRDLQLAAVKAGSKPRFCPPAGKAAISSSEFMKHLGAIPQQERQRIDMTEATTRLLVTKYPCGS